MDADRSDNGHQAVMTLINLRWTLLLLGLCVGVAFEIPGAETRIALVSGEGNEDFSKVLDLATVLLSRDADLQLLDRADVSRALNEHELSLGGPVNAEHAVKAGHLLMTGALCVCGWANEN
jgi:hypothetical protein